MESVNIEKITELLQMLLGTTVCSSEMIQELKSRGMFSLADEAMLEALPNMQDRVMQMHEILMTKVGGYETMVEFLKHTCENGTVKLYGREYDSNESFQEEKPGSSKPSNFNHISGGVKRSLEGDDGTSGNMKRQAVSAQKDILYFNVQPPSVLFTGRSEELEALKEATKQNQSVTVIAQESWITGLSGIGKTELARMFIQSIAQDGDDPLINCIIWINAKSELTANADFMALARDKLKISTSSANGGEENISTILNKIYMRLEFRKSLIIFDNIENADLLEHYVPSCATTGNENISILAISQSSEWKVENEIRLSGLKESDAIHYAKKGLGIPFISDSVMNEKITKLVARLQYFPLAIRQAISYIKIKKTTTSFYGPDEYILDLDTPTTTLLRHSVSVTGTVYKKTIYQTVELILNGIKEDENFGLMATRLVYMLAYITPSNITKTLYHELGEELEGALLVLEKYSLINIAPRKKDRPFCVNIHNLVQEVLCDIFESKPEEDNFLPECLGLLEGKINSSPIQQPLPIKHFFVQRIS